MKEYPINGLEQDAVYGKKYYKYLSNNTALVKWIKRQMNKRFRKRLKQTTND